MVKVKTSELRGPALDWTVAKCEESSGTDNAEAWLRDYRIGLSTRHSQVWSQGGPIIERYAINLFYLDPKREEDSNFWVAHIDGVFCRYGLTALIAAMRCYVVSKLGEEVEIPKELVNG